MSGQTVAGLTKEQFERMRKIRKEISKLRQQLNNLALESKYEMLYLAEEQLAGPLIF